MNYPFLHLIFFRLVRENGRWSVSIDMLSKICGVLGAKVEIMAFS